MSTERSEATDAPVAATAFPRVLDATMLSDWRSCPHKFFRRHVQGLVRPRTNVHLHFGACVARGLEVARRTYWETRDTGDALHCACEAVIESWGGFEPPVAPTRTEAAKTLSACLAAIQSYLAEWSLDTDPFQIHEHMGQPCIEWSGAWPIPGSRHPETGEPLLYAGRFDLIGDFQHSTWGLDDKTTGSSPDSDMWRNQWKLRSQFSGYAWLARQYGIPLKGFIVRGLGILKTDIKLGWALAPRPDWLVDRWLAQLRDDTEKMCHQYTSYEIDGGAFKTNGHAYPQVFDSACADFGGCTYLDLCSSEHPDDWLSEFEVSRWDPLVRKDIVA